MPRGVEGGLGPRQCDLSGCGLRFTPRRRDQRFCTPACRKAAYESRKFEADLEQAIASGRLELSTEPRRWRPVKAAQVRLV